MACSLDVAIVRLVGHFFDGLLQLLLGLHSKMRTSKPHHGSEVHRVIRTGECQIYGLVICLQWITGWDGGRHPSKDWSAQSIFSFEWFMSGERASLWHCSCSSIGGKIVINMLQHSKWDHAHGLNNTQIKLMQPTADSGLKKHTKLPNWVKPQHF